MSKNKLITLIVSCVVLILLLLLVTFMLINDSEVLGIKVSSIKTLLGLNEKINEATENYETEKTNYNSTIKKLETAKDEYAKEKTKYDAISQETIEMIKQAIKKEQYNIEYMWIKLGNYAKTNNLSIVLVEPGGSGSSSQESKVSDETSKSSVESSSDTKENIEKTSTNSPITSSSDTLKVEITGNYLNISDFIYEVESDTELRFKLDNISMEYVGNNNIKATFDVKNLIMLKK